MGKTIHVSDNTEAVDVFEMLLHWSANFSQSGILNCIMFAAFWFPDYNDD